MRLMNPLIIEVDTMFLQIFLISTYAETEC